MIDETKRIDLSFRDVEKDALCLNSETRVCRVLSVKYRGQVPHRLALRSSYETRKFTECKTMIKYPTRNLLRPSFQAALHTVSWK